MTGNAWPGLHAAGLADIDQLAEKPNAFFGALDKANEKIANDELQAETFARCVGAYSCECGSRFEFTEESDLTDFAALNSWHGHHNRCAEFRELEATGLALVGTVRNLSAPCAPSPAAPPSARAASGN